MGRKRSHSSASPCLRTRFPIDNCHHAPSRIRNALLYTRRDRFLRGRQNNTPSYRLGHIYIHHTCRKCRRHCNRYCLRRIHICPRRIASIHCKHYCKRRNARSTSSNRRLRKNRSPSAFRRPYSQSSPYSQSFLSFLSFLSSLCYPCYPSSLCYPYYPYCSSSQSFPYRRHYSRSHHLPKWSCRHRYMHKSPLCLQIKPPIRQCVSL